MSNYTHHETKEAFLADLDRIDRELATAHRPSVRHNIYSRSRVLLLKSNPEYAADLVDDRS